MNAIRLWPMGRKKNVIYRIVVADSRAPVKGRYLEKIGYYDPHTEPATIQIDDERARHWMVRGAQPSDTVRSMLVNRGVIGIDGKAIGLSGTTSDPVVMALIRLLSDEFPDLRKSPRRLVEFATGLSNYVDKRVQINEGQSEALEELLSSMLEWTEQFANDEAREKPQPSGVLLSEKIQTASQADPQIM